MAQKDVLPFEIKRIIYDYSDLPNIKQLRLVSRAWAVAGVGSLLLPRFSVRSFDDILRLQAIGANPQISQHAVKTVNTLVLQTRGWDLKYFNYILCNRHESRNRYEVGEFICFGYSAL